MERSRLLVTDAAKPPLRQATGSLIMTLGNEIQTTMRVSCTECGASILQDTATRNGGLCAPCKNGTRRSLEVARLLREQAKIDPFDILFRNFRDRAATHGLRSLTSAEAAYYAVASLFSDLNRGGVQLYLDVNSMESRNRTRDGLTALGRSDLLIWLDEASVLFGEREAWYATTESEDDEPPHEERFARITDHLLGASEDIFSRLEGFAVDHRLVLKGSVT